MARPNTGICVGGAQVARAHVARDQPVPPMACANTGGRTVPLGPSVVVTTWMYGPLAGGPLAQLAGALPPHACGRPNDGAPAGPRPHAVAPLTLSVLALSLAYS